MGLTRTHVAELEKLEHSQRTYDLYRMGFNPILAAPELVPVRGRTHAQKSRSWRVQIKYIPEFGFGHLDLFFQLLSVLLDQVSRNVALAVDELHGLAR
jgi:hypothetical protein